MNKLKIAIGADHRGFALKNYLLDLANDHAKIEWVDCGTYSMERTDYPIYTKAVVQKLLSKEVELGVLLCGSGIGMSICANRYKGIFAGLCWSLDVAIAGKQDDNVNVLVLPADFISVEQSKLILDAWLLGKFKEGRYLMRLQMIDEDCK